MKSDRRSVQQVRLVAGVRLQDLQEAFVDVGILREASFDLVHELNRLVASIPPIIRGE